VWQGRIDEARRLFAKLAGTANDVGLFSEEYDPAAERQLGNTPQAFTHLAFVNSALAFDHPEGITVATMMERAEKLYGTAPSRRSS
jgi:GH15 family glucan-1,4-alpha-glucosidase